MLTRRQPGISLLVIFGIAVLGAWLLRPNLSRNGLNAEYNNGLTRVERIALVTANDAAIDPTRPVAVKWSGYLYLPVAGDAAFRIPGDVDSTLTIDGQTVFDTTPSNQNISIELSAGGHAITFEVSKTPTDGAYFQAALEWQTPLGWRLIPAAYLYPNAPDPQSAQRTIRLHALSYALGWLAALIALALIAQFLWEHRSVFRSRTAFGLAALVLLAFSLRLLFLHDYALQPTADLQGIGSDNRGYQSNAIDSLRGLWPRDAFYVQPGMSLALGAIYSIFGPHIRTAQLAQMINGALITLIVFDLARRTHDDTAGWIAALLWAIFPLPIFYEAQLLTHGLEAQVGIVLVWLWMRTLTPTPALPGDERYATGEGEWRWLIILGLALGAASVLRPTFLVLAPFMAFSLLWQRMAFGIADGKVAALSSATSVILVTKSAAKSVAIFALITLLPIFSITWHNYQASGHFQLLTSNSGVTLYLGNNRDSTGLGEYSPAYLATHTLVNRGETTYEKQTLDDIRADPVRWLQLMARKTALYFGDPELPNNVDFYADGVGISPALSVLPLRFGAMMALALAGAVVMFRNQSRGGSALSNRACNAFPNRAYNALPNRACNALPNRVYNALSNRACNALPNRACNALPNRAYNALPNRACNALPNRACNALPNRACNALPNRACNALLLVTYVTTQSLVTMAYHVFSRFRAPIYAALAVMAAWAVAGMIASLRQRAWRTSVLQAGIIAISGMLIANLPTFAERVMSRPVLSSLPPRATLINAPIGDTLTLLGYDPLPAVKPGQPLFVTLYWQSSAVRGDDVYATVQLLADPVGAQKIAQADQAIGTGSFPDYPANQWKPGEIIWDRYLINIPDGAPTPLALTVLVAAYDRKTGQRVGETTFGYLPLTLAEPLTLPADAIPVGAKVGAATLAAYKAVLDGDTLIVTLYWQAGELMNEDGVVFVHLFDSAGNFVTGQDGKPRNGFYSTLAWQTGEGIVDEHRIPLPSTSSTGLYQVAIGMYDAATQSRLPVVNSNGEAISDDELKLGIIQK